MTIFIYIADKLTKSQFRKTYVMKVLFKCQSPNTVGELFPISTMAVKE